jgi:hypothetical protein
MVVLTHGPDTCAAAHTEYGDMARYAMDHKDEASKKHGVNIQGSWVDAPAHLLYLLVDAPNAHVVSNLMTELKFFLWSTIDIHPIVTLEEAMKLAK